MEVQGRKYVTGTDLGISPHTFVPWDGKTEENNRRKQSIQETTWVGKTEK